MQHTVFQEKGQEISVEEVGAENVDMAGKSPTPKTTRKHRASKTKARAALADLHDNEAVEVDDKRKRRKIAN